MKIRILLSKTKNFPAKTTRIFQRRLSFVQDALMNVPIFYLLNCLTKKKQMYYLAYRSIYPLRLERLFTCYSSANCIERKLIQVPSTHAFRLYIPPSPSPPYRLEKRCSVNEANFNSSAFICQGNYIVFIIP